MQTSSISYLKKEIQSMPNAELIEVCSKLIKFKKENKEMLHYILFESTNEKGYIQNLKTEVDDMFKEVNTQTIYWAKKTVRKILRYINKYCKFSGIATTYIELLIHFCKQMKALPLDWTSSKVMVNIYESQLKKIDKYMTTLHEDLQYDYEEEISNLRK